MGYFLVYMLKSGFCLVLFYLFYRLFLWRDTYFRFNRIVLLSMTVAAFLLPFIPVSVEQPVFVQQQSADWEKWVLLASEKEGEDSSHFWYVFFFYLYGMGVAFLLFQIGRSMLKIRNVMKKARHLQIDRVSVWLLDQDCSPFSWMNHVFLSSKDWAENGEEILLHEKAHVEAGHAYDLIFMNICVLLQWFNPAAWLFRQDLQTLHEYQADEAVIQHGIDAKKYQLLLIKKTVGSQRFISVANSFNQSNLKLRIIMMLKSKSNPWGKLKLIGIFPLAAMAVVAFARPEVSHELETLSAVKFTEFLPDVTQTSEFFSSQAPDSLKVKGLKGKVFFVVDSKPISEDSLRLLDPQNIQSMDVLKNPSPEVLRKYGLKDSQGIVLVTTKRSDEFSKDLDEYQKDWKKRLNTPVIIVDGELYTEELSDIDPSTIQSISVYKDEGILDTFKEKYGVDVKNGVIEITLKK